MGLPAYCNFGARNKYAAKVPVCVMNSGGCQSREQAGKRDKTTPFYLSENRTVSNHCKPTSYPHFAHRQAEKGQSFFPCFFPGNYQQRAAN